MYARGEWCQGRHKARVNIDLFVTPVLYCCSEARRRLWKFLRLHLWGCDGQKWPRCNFRRENSRYRLVCFWCMCVSFMGSENLIFACLRSRRMVFQPSFINMLNLVCVNRIWIFEVFCILVESLFLLCIIVICFEFFAYYIEQWMKKNS